MTPTDAARAALNPKDDSKDYDDVILGIYGPAIARALLNAEERERSAIEIINRILPYAMMTDDVREEVESAILKIIGTLEATGKAGG